MNISKKQKITIGINDPIKTNCIPVAKEVSIPIRRIYLLDLSLSF